MQRTDYNETATRFVAVRKMMGNDEINLRTAEIKFITSTLSVNLPLST